MFVQLAGTAVALLGRIGWNGAGLLRKGKIWIARAVGLKHSGSPERAAAIPNSC